MSRTFRGLFARTYASLRERFVFKFSLRTTLLVGTAVRLLLMPFTAHPFDVYVWYVYCMDVLRHGFDFSVLKSVNPLWFLTLTPIAFVYGVLSSATGWGATAVDALPASFNPHYGIAWVPGPLFNTLVKVPMLITDAATTVVIYKLVAQFWGREKARMAAMVFFLNPAVIWISSAWGQYDSIPAFFTVLSLFYLVEKRLICSSLSLLIATLFKIYPIAFLIPISVYLFKRESIGNLVRFLSTFLVPASLGLIFYSSSLMTFVQGFFSTDTFYGIFGFGLTYWSVSLLYPLDVETFRFISIGLMIILFSISLYYICREKYDDKLRGLTISAILLAASMFLSIRYPTEQRVVWLVPFMAIAVSGGYISEKMFWALSMISFTYMQKTFPQYLLPVAALNVNAFLPLFQIITPFRIVTEGALMPSPASAAILSILGILFSLLVFKICLRLLNVIG